VTRRTTSLALCLVALLTGACARTGIGVAARVGGHVIEVPYLTDRVDRGYANKVFSQRYPKTALQRVWLTGLVNRVLVDEAARRLHVSVTQQDVDAMMRNLADERGSQAALERAYETENGVNVRDLGEIVNRIALRDAVADKLVEDLVVTDAQLRATYAQALPRLDRAHIAHILVADRTTALTVVRAARTGDFAKLAKQYSKDTRTSTEGGDLGEIGNGEGKFDKAFEEAVFKAGTGDVVGPLKAKGGYEVVKVIERRTRTFEQVHDDLRRAVIGQARQDALNRYLNDLARELGITVNPRFGRWDFETSAVADVGDDLSSPAPSPGDIAPGVVPGQGQQGTQPGGPQQATPAPTRTP
jgi:parvulin-like peptidyl-prolyl isomerase